MQRRILLWTVAHTFLFPALIVASRTIGPRGDLVLLLVGAPILGILQAMLIPAVEGRWIWPILTCAGALIALFFCCTGLLSVGLMLGLAQCHFLTAAGHRWGPLWIPASGLGWLGGLVAGQFVANALLQAGRADARWLPLVMAILGLTYGLATGLTFVLFREEAREPGRPWSRSGGEREAEASTSGYP
jgi:hypothetical protein